MIQPTVGRIVWFRPGVLDIDAEMPGGRTVPRAAIITYVWNDRMVNLAVFSVNGNTFARTSVRLRQPEDEADDNMFCEWMPYQVKKPTGSESGEKAAGTQAV